MTRLIGPVGWAAATFSPARKLHLARNVLQPPTTDVDRCNRGPGLHSPRYATRVATTAHLDGEHQPLQLFPAPGKFHLARDVPHTSQAWIGHCNAQSTIVDWPNEARRTPRRRRSTAATICPGHGGRGKDHAAHLDDVDRTLQPGWNSTAGGTI